MIPFPVVPLKGVTVLVTRPLEQARVLCARIEAQGGEAVLFPTIEIHALSPPPNAELAKFAEFDWAIFVSVNAVKHGLGHLVLGQNTRIAAIGPATAAALEANSKRVDATPETLATSEGLLSHPALATIATQRTLIVKGMGGRELLHDALLERGAMVTTIDVYRRALPKIDASAVTALEQRWRENQIDIVTLTSVESLDNLCTMLTDDGRSLLAKTPFVAVSERIAASAAARGFTGTFVPTRGADDDSIVGAIAAWHARAR